VKCTVCGAADFEVISQDMIEKIAAVEGGLQEETTYDGRKLRWSEEARKGLWTMKNAYQRRRVKARVEKRARMKKLDAITLAFAREVIEEETGSPLEIQVPSASPVKGADATGVAATGGGDDTQAKLMARDDKKNPLISTFEWTDEAVQRIFRVPAGFMRNQTQERVEELARERVASTIDLKLVEDGIEIGKKMMAEMIANYQAPGKTPATTVPAAAPAPEAPAQASAARTVVVPAGNGSGYLNEVSPSPLSARGESGERREA
jgi:hypothetical protein